MEKLRDVKINQYKGLVLTVYFKNEPLIINGYINKTDNGRIDVMNGGIDKIFRVINLLKNEEITGGAWIAGVCTILLVENNEVIVRIWGDDINEGNPNYSDKCRMVFDRNKFITLDAEILYNLVVGCNSL